MAVVKSPKNTKRKKLWVKKLTSKFTKKIIKRSYITDYSRKGINLYRKLEYRHKKNLTVNGFIMFL